MTACDTAKTCFNPIDLAPAFAHIWNRLPVTTWALRFPSIRSNSKIMAQGEAITVSSLHIYPVKSCAGLQLQQAQVTPTGGKITWLPHFTRFGSSCDGPPCCGILGAHSCLHLSGMFLQYYSLPGHTGWQTARAYVTEHSRLPALACTDSLPSKSCSDGGAH